MGRISRVLSTLALVLSCCVCPVHAATLTVTATSDGGTGSLREAITNARPGDAIVFDLPAQSTLALTEGELVIEKNLVIDGSSVAGLTIDAGQRSRIFTLMGESTQLELRGLHLTNGQVPDNRRGGAVYSEGNLILSHCTLSKNSASGYGGAISSSGPVTMNSCTLINNSATIGGAIESSAALTLTNCVLAGNSVSSILGAICSWDSLHLRNCTLSRNTGGVFYYPIYSSSKAVIVNSIINDNEDCNFNGQSDKIDITYSMFNVGDWYPRFLDPDGFDFRLQADSPCINTGNNKATARSAKDRDGTPRVIGTAVDMGAYEYADPDTGIILGYVKDGTSGAALAGMKLSLLSTSLKTALTATTDENGYFQFDDLPPGVYSLSAVGPLGAATTYAAATSNLTISAGAVKELVLQAIPCTSDPAAQLSTLESPAGPGCPKDLRKVLWYKGMDDLKGYLTYSYDQRGVIEKISSWTKKGALDVSYIFIHSGGNIERISILDSDDKLISSMIFEYAKEEVVKLSLLSASGDTLFYQTFEYDNGRLSKQSVFDGNKELVSDALFGYSANGRLTYVMLFNGAHGIEALTLLSYDKEGRLISRKLFESNSESFPNSICGLLQEKKIQPEAAIVAQATSFIEITYRYDEKGRIINERLSERDRLRSSISFRYGKDGMLGRAIIYTAERKVRNSLKFLYSSCSEE